MITVIKVDRLKPFYTSKWEVLGSIADNLIQQHRGRPAIIANFLNEAEIALSEYADFKLVVYNPEEITLVEREPLLRYLNKVLSDTEHLDDFDGSVSAVIRQALNDVQRDSAITQSIKYAERGLAEEGYERD